MRIAILFTACVTTAAIAFFSCNPSAELTSVPDKPDFATHIAPIVFKHCAPCHRPGGIAPFPLLNYSQVRNRAKTIAVVTGKRFMPPWPADPKYSHFLGENVLTDIEIQTIALWVKQGSIPGTGGENLSFDPPQYRSSLGKPDMVLALDPVQIRSDYKDRFFLVKLPGTLGRDTFLRAVEFVPGTPSLVHHFNGHLLLYDFEKRADPAAGKNNVEITSGEYQDDLGQLNILNDDGSRPRRVHSVVNYLPGVQGVMYPAGIGTVRLNRKFAFIGNDMHYGPSEKALTDQSYLNLFFTNVPPERELGEIMLGTNGVSKIEPPLKIPAGQVSWHSTRFTLTADISVLTINPHMHLLGKSFLAYALKPNGDTIHLIRIPRWDFKWQNFYTFPKMLHIPKGSIIVAEGIFDNTEKNPHNPNRPPKEVGERLEFGGASMRASDEMFQFIITYTDYRPGDENISLEGKK